MTGYELPLRDEQLPAGAAGYCEFLTCENELGDDGGEVVLVSYGPDDVRKRRACWACAEIYNTGAQYGRFRAVRMLRAIAQVMAEEGQEAESLAVDAAVSGVNSVDDPGEAGATWEHEYEED